MDPGVPWGTGKPAGLPAWQSVRGAGTRARSRTGRALRAPGASAGSRPRCVGKTKPGRETPGGTWWTSPRALFPPNNAAGEVTEEMVGPTSRVCQWPGWVSLALGSPCLLSVSRRQPGSPGHRSPCRAGRFRHAAGPGGARHRDVRRIHGTGRLDIACWRLAGPVTRSRRSAWRPRTCPSATSAPCRIRLVAGRRRGDRAAGDSRDSRPSRTVLEPAGRRRRGVGDAARVLDGPLPNLLPRGDRCAAVERKTRGAPPRLGAMGGVPPVFGPSSLARAGGDERRNLGTLTRVRIPADGGAPSRAAPRAASRA